MYRSLEFKTITGQRSCRSDCACSTEFVDVRSSPGRPDMEDLDKYSEIALLVVSRGLKELEAFVPTKYNQNYSELDPLLLKVYPIGKLYSLPNIIFEVHFATKIF